MKINIQLRLKSINPEDNLLILEQMLRDEYLRVSVKKAPPKAGELGSSYLDILSVILNASAVGIGLKGLFECIKTYIETNANDIISFKYEDIEIECHSKNKELIQDIIELTKQKEKFHIENLKKLMTEQDKKIIK